MNKFIAAKITDIIDEARGVKTFFFDFDIDAKPGNFVMVWLPGVSEKPFAIAYTEPAAITVKALGSYTHQLFGARKGDRLWIRGPYGNAFTDFVARGKKYLIAGGTGAAPIAMLAEALGDVPTIFLGGRTKDDLVFEERLRRCSELFVSTNDGSKGVHGVVTDIFDYASVEKGVQFFVCGPEKMMLATCRKAVQYTEPENIFCSVEKHMKCARGVCGQCDLGGYRVCTDGPVFSYAQLMECKDFGASKRDMSGCAVPLDH